jgi:hypothetical protein
MVSGIKLVEQDQNKEGWMALKEPAETDGKLSAIVGLLMDHGLTVEDIGIGMLSYPNVAIYVLENCETVPAKELARVVIEAAEYHRGSERRARAERKLHVLQQLDRQGLLQDIIEEQDEQSRRAAGRLLIALILIVIVTAAVTAMLV